MPYLRYVQNRELRGMFPLKVAIPNRDTGILDVGYLWMPFNGAKVMIVELIYLKGLMNDITRRYYNMMDLQRILSEP